MPELLANALTNASVMRMSEPIANEVFLPHLPLIQELIYGVTMAGKKRLAEMLQR